MGCAWPCSLHLPCQAGVTRCLAMFSRISWTKTCPRSEQGFGMDWLDFQVPNLGPKPNVEGSHTCPWQSKTRLGRWMAWVPLWAQSQGQPLVAGWVREKMLQVKDAE